ncbi:MAG: PAS domain-containing methyl-accepting chemotaxis protein [Proteobacteria bacterium]|nr:PAS domain-containing methyl-accepting chemotaxis protein [Pseudomonadota bacterium]
MFATRLQTEMKAKLAALDKSQAVIEFEPSGIVLGANQNFLAALGYEHGEIRGRHHSMFVDAQVRGSKDYQRFWHELASGKFQAGEFKRIAKGGREIWIQATYNPIVDGKGRVMKVVKFASDVTAAKIQCADYAGQIAAIGKSQAVIEFDVDGAILTANANFLGALGYTLDEIKGRHHSMFVDAEMRDSAEYRQFWAALARGKYQAAEYKRIGKGGKEIWIQASYNPILDLNGKPFKVVKYATDTTAQVTARLRNERAQKSITRNLDDIAQAILLASKQSTTAAQASTETTNTVQAIASGAEQLDASVKEIAETMSKSRLATDSAAESIRNANQATATLTTAAQAMNGIVELIEGIADQINLLALNATIEAARAGEQGRGFAVVATEVKNLAGQAKGATEQIAREIANVQEVSSNVAGILGAIGQSMDSLRQYVGGAAAAVEEQSAVTRDMSANMQMTASSVATVSDNLVQIAQSADRANSSAQQLKEAALALAA